MQHDGARTLQAHSLTSLYPSLLSAWLALWVRRLVWTGVGHTATLKGLVHDKAVGARDHGGDVN
jgi:hypothetical protein